MSDHPYVPVALLPRVELLVPDGDWVDTKADLETLGERKKSLILLRVEPPL
jgi:hypothetical protein